MTSSSEAATVAVDDFGSPEAFLAAVDATIKYFNDGDIVTGTVVKVDGLPQTEMALAERISNKDLAHQFTRQGAPLQVEIRLQKGPAGPASYDWTSQRGQEVELTSGTLLEGQVTVRTGRPNELVIPAIRHWLGL